ncbi:MAG TPA: immune inhibitor A [Chloroflexota bacterium]|nr:immune inhibitor A [Chloroflexota bacterium]
MSQKKRLATAVFILLLLVACSGNTRVTPTAVPTAMVNDQLPTVNAPTPTTAPPATEIPRPIPSVSSPTPDNQPPITDNRLPITDPYPNLSRAPVTEAERLTAERLESHYPPDRDDVALLVAYKGATPPTEAAALVSEPLPVGTQQLLTINNTDTNTNTSAEFVLMYVSDHAYFWFDTTPGLAEPAQTTLQQTGAGFDEIYRRSHLFFDTEASPGVDGDPRIHIVNASPVNLCDIGPTELDFCYLAGYFSSHDLIPHSVDPTSNAREMFVMNGRGFGYPGYLDTLAHEFRHMIEANYDNNDWDWAVEGSAMLAEELVGYPGDGVYRANLFLQNPDQQLNRWTDGNTLPYYGQGYLLNRYIFNRLGEKLYRDFANHPEPAFTALDDLAQTYNLDFGSGLELWLDWLAALAMHNVPGAPETYALADGVRAVNPSPLPTAETTVNQYAADYYTVPAGQKNAITFTGSNHAPLLPVLPPSGAHMWLANRANFSAVRLTRAFDLTAVTQATLTYDVYHDIEVGYDFAYVTASSDGGQTWQPLTGAQMQGHALDHDPSESALTERFYTGTSDGWVQESIDLTPFAGQEILLRLEYVTDPILTFGGLALDNIAIPEIGYVDDAESDMGWTAEGFVRATGYVPQTWHLIFITFDETRPVVQAIEVMGDGTAVITPPNSTQDSILIVAATAPMTLLPAYYRLSVDGNR